MGEWASWSLSAVSSLGKNNCAPAPGNDVKVPAMMGDVPEGGSGRIHVAMAMLTQAEAGSGIWYPTGLSWCSQHPARPLLCRVHSGSGF